jgi:hypothetical protein
MEKYFLNLRLFDEGGEPPEAEVVYGNPPEGGNDNNAAAEVDYDAVFEKLIKDERYKPSYDKRMGAAIKDRFKSADADKKQLASAQRFLDAASVRYGVDPADIDGLLAAMDDDSGYIEQQSMQSGMSVDAFKQHQSLLRDSRELQRMRENQQAQTDLNGWMEEAAALKETYPNLNVLAEIGNPQTGNRFLGALRNGLTVEDAYFMVHRNELMGGVMQHTAQKAVEKVTNDIKARGMRPAENGAGGGAPAKVYKNDPSAFTDDDVERVHRMMLEGKKIEL